MNLRQRILVKRKYLDIPYASPSRAQKLDIYLPDEGESPFPVIVWSHGGEFMGCDKADLQVQPALEGLKRGYAVVPSMEHYGLWLKGDVPYTRC